MCMHLKNQKPTKWQTPSRDTARSYDGHGCRQQSNTADEQHDFAMATGATATKR